MVSKTAFRTHSRKVSSFTVTLDHKKRKDTFVLSAPPGAIELQREAIDWQLVYRDKVKKVLCATASETTDYVNEGELVFMVIFRDGRKIRIGPDDFTRDSASKINAIIRKMVFGNFRTRLNSKKRTASGTSNEHDP